MVEANAIGTAYLRAQTIAEPERSESIELLRSYAAARLRLARLVTDTLGFDRSVADSSEQQRSGWALAGAALDAAPQDSAPRLCVESLNTMFDAGTSREGAFLDRIPGTVVALQS